MTDRVTDFLVTIPKQVDVLAEFPAIIRRALSAAIGIKPFIFQVSFNPLRLYITHPSRAD